MIWLYIGLAVGLVSGVFFVIMRKKNKRMLTVDEVVGARAIVVECIDNYAGSGIVKVGNQMWAARAVSDDDVFRAGETVLVVALEGVRLICKA
jgi:membrane protein implicated in regulation of membrane protease activity